MRDKIYDVFEDSIGMGCLIVFLALILITGIFFLEGLIVWALWNGVAVAIFTFINPISYWMALGLMVLCNILFKGATSISHRD